MEIVSDKGFAVQPSAPILVSSGFKQIEVGHFEQTFPPVIKFAPVKILLTIALHFSFDLHRMDFVTTFQRKYLEEEKIFIAFTGGDTGVLKK